MRSLIRETRIQKGWTQADLVEKSGLSYNTVAFAERGYAMSRKTADALSAVLGLSLTPIDNPDRIAKAALKIAEREAEAAIRAEAAERAGRACQTSSEDHSDELDSTLP